MFAPNLRRKIFGWLERLKNSAAPKNSARRLAAAAEGSNSPTKFLQPANLTTYTILSLFNLQEEIAPGLLSP